MCECNACGELGSKVADAQRKKQIMLRVCAQQAARAVAGVSLLGMCPQLVYILLHSRQLVPLCWRVPLAPAKLVTAR